ncbi:plasma-membrane proton-efflux P-type ATPase [bacterium BMS3Abin03]|nr:plasma-membrane proton-efflux P-type ATPase [bacterium BMS3Abin03]MCG6960172.1 plasma-membrane proton-efflux P-type ATPase [bacterium BMS3Abin03]
MNNDVSDINKIKKLSVEESFQKFSSGENGLNDSNINDRIKEYGYNEISEKKVNPLVKFLSYFWGPIPWMIEVAAILSAIISHWEDFWIIFALLLLNATVGFWQEYKADDAINLLKQKLALVARVFRNGKWNELQARELVPGDVVRVRLGDIVPADLKLFKGDYLSIDESALTGESLPVEKRESDVAYSGSVIRQGEMNGLVVATGVNTFFGKTAQLVQEARTISHFQKAVIKIGNYLIVLAAFMIAIIFMVSVFRHESFWDTLQFALVLTIAAIPVALPAVLSVTMAVGASVLAKKKAIVSKLTAIEEMAGMDILCSDKTGTITKNELTLADVISFEGFTSNDVLVFASLASREEDKDPIDSAIITKTKSDKSLEDRLASYQIKEFKPFDPVIKRSEVTVIDQKNKTFKISKGAPQVILALLSGENKEKLTDNLNKQIDEFASKGFRALGSAKTSNNGEWEYVGLIPLFDPPRDDSAETIKTAEDMGVNVKMITGDHTAIAKQIAQQVNLNNNITEASVFLKKPDKEASAIVEKTDGFAQVFPEHKYKIVELLQENDHIVGMTGDGVNDSPALKKADVGIAVAGATDAAKSAADIVLTLPGLSVIIDALKESRKIFQRMNSYAIYRIAETIRVLLFITLAIIVFNFYPVTAIMIVLLALFNDAPIMAIAYDNVKYSNDPEKWNMRVVLGMATFLGLIGVVSSFGIFYIGQNVLHLSRDAVQSFIFLKLAVAGHLTIFVTRTRGPFWSIKPSGTMFWAAVLTKLLATFVAVYGWFITPISWNLALLVWGYALVAFFITDLLKVRIYKLLDHTDIKFHK